MKSVDEVELKKDLSWRKRFVIYMLFYIAKLISDDKETREVVDHLELRFYCRNMVTNSDV